MTLASFLNKAKDHAIACNEKQLASWTTKIDEVDLLSVFEASFKTQKERLFWTNSSRDFAFIGLGSLIKLVAHDERFKTLQTEWEDILDKAMIDNQYNEAGTGLVAAGGMSFDPLRKPAKLWENYPTSQLTIPEYLILKNETDYYLTINQYVNPDEDIETTLTEINDLKAVLLENELTINQVNQHVIAKKEIRKQQWLSSVEEAVATIKRNEANKIVLAREIRIKLNESANIALILQNLLDNQANSYIFAFEHGTDCFIGASPERLIKVEKTALLSTCLAGTAPRGKTAAEDKQLADELLMDDKNREEHDYVVQMITENIASVCDNIDMPVGPVILPLRNLQHLYTPISATLKPEYTVFDIIEKLHPTPALGGVPRTESLAFIREHEVLDRGWYGSPVGWLDSNQNSEFVVAIRSGLVQADEVSLFAGCGVMRDSNAEMEYEETNVKFLPMLHALEGHDESY